ncbi:MAG TPA: TIGR03619 family F420-dependent LLM class oxidoreductase, partial [Gemmatimonadales bacterium]|nr:TIGR03619 family F420-dependent LLM class oxidoreductase [Gemmatimonadales bacterium]
GRVPTALHQRVHPAIPGVNDSMPGSASGRLQFGFSVFPYSRFRDVEELAQVVSLGDELGFDAAALPEHLLPPAWPGADLSAKLWYDLPALITFLAARTSRIAFLTSVLVVPYHHPVRLAKALATVDVLSGGRLWLGVGTGWMAAEFRRLGIPYEARGAITDEYLRAMIHLWSSERPSFHGNHVSFDDVSFFPKPVQRPHMPIMVGGTGPRPFSRVVEIGQGWYPMSGGPEEIQRGVKRLRELLTAAGRDPSSLWVGCGGVSMGEDPQTARMRHDAGAVEAGGLCRTPGEAIDRIHRYRAAGATFISLGVNWANADELGSRLKLLASDVLPAFRDSSGDSLTLWH